ncbi:MAG: type II toxin-antitoxin system RelB/DinJ family antitoxin [Propionibacteriaceae bacterium]|jgi:antitoxin component of RelBE/YafQ-DinJ toxin-antitoxin module|nr:type II toxin-antitoxin system RelB/DinJ family antitoxin [Propionibacteriaceae bacterium]
MALVLVNGRVDERVKRQADEVLAAHHKTPTDAIRSLYQYLADQRDLPAFMRPTDDDGADRRRRWEALRSVAGLTRDPAIATDEGYERARWDEAARRYGL